MRIREKYEKRNVVGCITLAAVPRFIRAPIHTNNIFRNDIPLLYCCFSSQRSVRMEKESSNNKKRHLINLNPGEFFHTSLGEL